MCTAVPLRNTCSLSGDCVKTCPVNALQFTGYKITVDDVMLEIEKDLAFYESSGGGVTLTGGEALYQPQFSAEILKRCKELNIHTAIETCLYCEKEDIDLILPYIDLFYVDLKLFDAALHKQYTGKGNGKIKDNFKYISATGKKVIVRIPLIEDITDTNLNRTAIMDFVFEADRNIPVELINYNPLTENNYTRLGLPFILKKSS